jgi:hypothetical protein
LVLLAAACAWGQRAVDPTGGAAEPLAPAKTVEELESRYAAVLLAMKNPEVTGILVGELGPNSLGAAAGLRPGDILTQYEGVKLDNRADEDRAEMLRDAVGKVLIDGDKPGADPKVTLVVRRGGKTMVLRAARGPLGVRAMAVEAGVGLPMNPRASERGSFALAWGEMSGWFKVGGLEGNYGAERQLFGVTGKTATLTVSTRGLGVDGRVEADGQAAGIRMGISDRKETYGINIDTISYIDEIESVGARVRGGKVSGEITRKATGIRQSVERPTVPEAVASLAVPSLAAALPKEAGVVMPLAVISETDLQTRLGYALETRGEQPLKMGTEDVKCYVVRLWHLGQVESTYYFSPKRELIYAETESGLGGVTLTRVESEGEAIKGMVPAGRRLPATVPATLPGTRAVVPGDFGKDGK